MPPASLESRRRRSRLRLGRSFRSPVPLRLQNHREMHPFIVSLTLVNQNTVHTHNKGSYNDLHEFHWHVLLGNEYHRCLLSLESDVGAPVLDQTLEVFCTFPFEPILSKTDQNIMLGRMPNAQNHKPSLFPPKPYLSRPSGSPRPPCRFAASRPS